MNRRTRVILFISALMVLAGLILFAVVMAAIGWDFKKLGTITYETRTHTIDSEFESISIYTSAADLVLMPSEDGTCRAVLYEDASNHHAVYVREGALYIEAERKMTPLDFSFDKGKITLFLPKAEYAQLSVSITTGDTEIPADFRFSSLQLTASTGDVLCRAEVSGDLSVSTTTGAIVLENAAAESLSLSVTTGGITLKSICGAGDVRLKQSTGKTYLTDVSAKSVSSAGTTGDVFLTRVRAGESVTLQRTTGDITFTECDAPKFSASTTSGSILGTLLTGKVFEADTATGTVSLPASGAGGVCALHTTTGDIRISLAP